MSIVRTTNKKDHTQPMRMDDSMVVPATQVESVRVVQTALLIQLCNNQLVKTTLVAMELWIEKPLLTNNRFC